MTPIQQAKLRYWREQIGAMTADEALELAIENEALAKACGPFDGATKYLLTEQHRLTEYAELLEAERAALSSTPGAP